MQSREMQGKPDNGLGLGDGGNSKPCFGLRNQRTSLKGGGTPYWGDGKAEAGALRNTTGDTKGLCTVVRCGSDVFPGSQQAGAHPDVEDLHP